MPTRRSLFRLLRRGLLGLAVLLVALWALRGPLLTAPASRLIEDILADEVGIRVRIGELRLGWLGDAELTDVRLIESPGFPGLRDAHVRRIAVEWSLLDLLRGREGVIRDVDIDGLRATLDPDLISPAEPDADPSEGGESSAGRWIPAHASIRDVEVTVHTGTATLRATGLVIEGTAEGLRRAEVRVTAEGLGIASPAFERTVARIDLTGRHTGSMAEVRGGFDGDDGALSLDLAVADPFGDRPRLSGKVALNGTSPSDSLRRVLVDLGADLASAEATVRIDGLSPDGSEGRVDLVATLVDAALRGRRLGRVEVRAEGEANGLSVEATARGPLGEFHASGTAGLDGAIDIGWDASVPDLAAPDVDLDGRRPGGGLSARGRFRMVDGDVVAAEVIAGGRRLTLDGVEVGEIDLDAILATGELEIRSFSARRGPDRLELRGRVTRAEDPVIEIAGRVDITDLASFGPLVEARLRGGVNGEFEISGPLSGPAGRLELAAVGLELDDLAVRRVDIDGRATPRNIDVTVRIDVDDGDSADVTLAVSRPEPDRFVGAIPRGTVTHRGRRLVFGDGTRFEVDTAGVGRADVRLAGDDGLRIVGSDLARDADGAVSGRIEVAGFELAALTELLALARPVAGTASATVDFSGVPDRPRIDVVLGIDAPHVDLEGDIDLELHRITLEAGLDDRLLTVREFRAETRTGRLSAEGTLRFPHGPDPLSTPERIEIEGRVDATDLRLERVAFVPKSLRVAGGLTLHATVGGTVATPSGRGTIALTGGSLRAGPSWPEIDGLDLSASADDEEIVIDSLRARIAGDEVTLRGRVGLVDLEPAETTLALTAESGDLRALLARLGVALPDGLAGAASVSLDVTGPASAPRVSVAVTGRNLRRGAEGPADLTLEATVGGGRAVLSTCRLDTHRGRLEATASLDAEISLWPPAFRTGSLAGLEIEARVGDPDAAVSGGLSLDGLAALLPADSGISRTDGHIALLLRHRPGDPLSRVTGRLVLRDGDFRTVDRPRRVREIQADLALDGSKIEIRRLSGRYGHAPFEITGTASIDSGATAYDLNVRADRVLLIDEPTTRLRTDLRLRIAGASDSARVSGDVVVRDLVYTANVRYLDLQSRPSLAPLPLTTDPFLTRTALDLHVVAPGGLRVANNILTADLAADLRVRGTVAYPEVDGLVRTISGKFSIPGVSLDIDEGEVRFFPNEPLRPNVAFVGHTTRQRIRIEVTANGPADRLVIDMASDPSLPREDILTLLTTGVLASDLSAESAGTALAWAGASFLYGEIRGESEIEDENDESTLQRFIREAADRTEVTTDSVPGGRNTIVTASVRVLDWLRLQGERDEVGEFNIDVVFRIFGR